MDALAKTCFLQASSAAALSYRVATHGLTAAGAVRVRRVVALQGKAALEMDQHALACSHLAMAAKLAPDDSSAGQKLCAAVRLALIVSPWYALTFRSLSV